MAIDRRILYYTLFIFTILIASSFYLSWTTEGGIGDLDVERGGVEVEPGRSVNFTVYAPRVPTYTNFLPVILTVHGVGGAKESMYPFGIELARRNFTVVSVDMAGHGDSNVPFEWDEYERLAEDCYAALEYVWLHYPNTAPLTYGVIGHSLGWHVGLAMYDQPAQPQALVAIGPVWMETVSTIPGNTLFALGEFDELISTATVMSTLQTATGNSSAEIGVTYGNLTEGTAYRFITSPSNHISEVTDRTIVIEAGTWMIQALQGEDQLNSTLKFYRPFFRDYDLDYPGKTIAYLIGAFAILASLIPLLLILVQKMPRRLRPQPLQNHERLIDARRSVVISILLGGLLILFFGITGNLAVSLGDPGLLWLTTYDSLGVVMFLIIWPVILVLVLLLTLPGKHFQDLLESLGFERGHPGAFLKTIARSIVPSIICIFWLLIWIRAGSGFESSDTVLILPVLRFPAGQRFFGVLLLSLIALPYSIGDSLWTSELLLGNRKWGNLLEDIKIILRTISLRLLPMMAFALLMVLGSASLGFVAGPTVVLGLYSLYLVIAISAGTFILIFAKVFVQNPWPAIFLNAFIYGWILVGAMPLI